MLFNNLDYLSSLEDKSFIEIIKCMETEVYKVESKLSSVRGAPRLREEGGWDYVNNLKGYLFFLRYGKKPAGVDISPLKQICINLIKKKELEDTILTLFK